MNPIYLSIPVFIAATLAFACAALYSIIHRKDEEIERLLEEIKKMQITSGELIESYKEDLKQADKDFDAKCYELQLTKQALQQANARTFTGRKRNNKGQFVVVAKDVEP